MKKLIFVFVAFMLSVSLLAQIKKPAQTQKIALMSDVFLMATWGDFITVDSLYSFQLTGHAGKIANMKVSLAKGTLDRLADDKYRVKINADNTEMDLTITKTDPIAKENKVLKHLVVPAKKK
ncbi:MAG: hypothetical protein P4L28_08305 [Paludibacteraceae bacterium]|nr:hypothetical protein [Paludibacteraceae bacterium]